MQDIFQHATRNKLRFQTAVGHLSVEDLWDIPLTTGRANLKTIATALSTQLGQQSKEELDFFDTVESTDPELQIKFDIVKHIVTTKVAEKKAKTEAKANESKQKEILALIADKKKESLASKSIAELEAMLK